MAEGPRYFKYPLYKAHPTSRTIATIKILFKMNPDWILSLPERTIVSSDFLELMNRKKQKPLNFSVEGLLHSKKLPGLDSNQQPFDYKFPQVSLRLGLSHLRPQNSGVTEPGASLLRGTSVRSSLCTFPTESAGLGSGFPCPLRRRLP